MTQDTRKDKRAKVVSLNVRYKSATVDEFIENHSHDVSKGGIFVKTPTPFPAGTLLKFEIRLAGDKSVISGVGRVVWKREPTQATSDKPAGMGVKFIKIDDASRAVIDKLTSNKADAGSAYTSDPAALEEDAPKPPGQPSTLRGIPAAQPVGGAAASGTSPVAAPAAAAPGAAAKAPVAAPSSAPSVAKGSGLGAPPAKTVPQGSVSPNLPAVKAAVPGAPPARVGGPPPPVAHRPATAIGMGPAPGPSGAKAPTSDSVAAAPPVKSEPRIGVPPPARPPVNARKATMMGVGMPAPSSAPGAGGVGEKEGKNELPTLNTEIAPVAIGGAAASTTASTPTSSAPRSGEPGAKSSTGPMFPKLEHDPAPHTAVTEPTMMKQAAELLEEALREAGGSIDEIGQNPLFSQSSQRGDKVEESKPSTAPQQSGGTLSMASPLAKSGGTSPSKSTSTAPEPVAAAASSPPPPSKREPAKPIGASIADDKADKKKGGVGGLVAGLLVAAVLGGGGLYAYKSGALSGEKPAQTAEPTSTTPPSPPSASAATDVGADSGSATSTSTDAGAASAAGALATGKDGGALDASATAATDAGATAATATTAALAPRPAPQPPPAARPAPRQPAPAPKPAPTATDPDFQPPPPEPKPTAAPTTTTTATPTATPTSTGMVPEL